MLGRAAIVALVALAVGCSHETIVRLPSESGGPVVAKGADPMPWSPTRRLSWSDFLGRPDLASDASATTAYVIAYESTCEGSTFTFQVSNTFRPDRSWVKPVLLMGSSQGRLTLQHEQAHFDLGEVHARELRRALSQLSDPCDRTEQERLALVNGVLRVDEEAQRRYDFETEFGMNLGRQLEWIGSVARQLDALKGYAR
jgi:Bacterial protein of unknown function (DUF922)